MFFHTNLRFLRERKKLTQEVAASALGIKRSTLNNYENAYAGPKLEALPLLAKYYKISIDNLIGLDLSTLSETQLRELESGHDSYTRGSKLRVLATTVDKGNRENIELVPIKAKAGYTAGYNDPEFIQSLPSFQLPFLSQDRKYRSFQIEGDSMLPIPDKSYIIAEYVTDWRDVKDGHAYIVVTADEGIVFKIVYNQLRKGKNILLRSLNPQYTPYEVSLSEIKEVWKFISFMSSDLPEFPKEADQILSSIERLREEVSALSKGVREQ